LRDYEILEASAIFLDGLEYGAVNRKEFIARVKMITIAEQN
jgi:hypothetical protein